MKNFKNKIVVITGAASGMGKAYAKAFAKLGSQLALCDINITDLKKLTEELSTTISKETIFFKQVDVSNEANVFEFANDVKKTLGNAHIVINNAGIEGNLVPFYNMSLKDFKRVMDINFYGVIYGSKAFLPHLIANNEGALVNVSSIFGLIGPPNNSDYAASKFAITGFTEALSVEFYKSPISIHCVHPGGINTNISKSEQSKVFAQKYLTTPPEKIVQHVINSILLKRSKIVYGNDSFRARFIANFVPKKIFIPLAWREMKSALSIENYKSFIPDILRKK
jgi:butyryl-CoA dehydrogenase